jgi:polyhydroxybutyrate depolymerase
MTKFRICFLGAICLGILTSYANLSNAQTSWRNWFQQRREQRQVAFSNASSAPQETSNHFSTDPLFTLSHDGLTRKYKVHLPANYNANQPTPVVIYLHGAAGNMKEAYNDQMDQASDKFGFILVAPNGTGRMGDQMATWNAGRWEGGECCGYAVKNNIDDVGFISQMIDEVKSKYNVDPQRIFAVGLSNGGMMSYRLALELSDKIASVAAVAPTAIPALAPKRPISVLHIHGTGDPMVPFQGGQSKFFVGPSAQRMADFWVKTNECPAPPTTVYQKGNATVLSYGPGKNNTEVELCTLQGAGHAWPSGHQYAQVNKIGPVSFDYSFDQMWEFLQKHPMPA